MDRWVDAGQFATGFFAFGQIATGFIAVGQVATGVIAIGQVARGGIAIGMVGFGLVSISMMGVGVVRTTALLGVGGTAGWGLVLPLVALPGRRARLPPTVSLAQLAREEVSAGWVAATVEAGPEGIPVFSVDGGRDGAREREVRLDARLRTALDGFVAGGPRRALVHITREDGRLIWDRALSRPRPAAARVGAWVGAALGLATLLAIAFVFWWVVALPIGELLRGPDGLLR